VNATCKVVLLVVLTCVAAPIFATDVVVNGTLLDNRTKNALDSYYQTRIPSARYWYDSFSGVWGLERGPAQRQILAGPRLGGPLRANASNGTTGVFVNARQLHYLEVAARSAALP
jgi:hypothetical protein